MTVTEMLFSLLRSELTSLPADEKIKNSITEENAKELYKLSKKYDIAQIIASALSKIIKLDAFEAGKAFRKELGLSVLRYERMNYDYECVCNAFEKHNIPYIPLKGSVIRDFYPEPWMRTSCDIDILVHEEDLDRAVSVLCDEYSFTTKGNRDYHDISVFSENGTHLELHFNIMENMENIDTLLERVWEYSKSCMENSCRYEMSHEYIIFHNIAHMAYHFVNGGCGIRPFADLYLLEKNLQYDENSLSKLCEMCGIDKFRLSMEKLSRVWMENEERDKLSNRVEQHIFSGGLYGNLETGSAVKHAKEGGHLKYIMTRVFQPYNVIKEKYPILKKHKWLMPIYQVKRWGVVLTLKRDGIGKHLKAGTGVSKEEINKKIELFDDVGLN